jgi:hypothetical protein
VKKEELMKLVGKRVKVTFRASGKEIVGELGFTKDFSEKYDYRHPNYFTINQYDFKVSHVKKVEVLEE